MADIMSPEKRSALMRRVKATDTTPELIVRRGLHRRGLRFRLHRKDLPGRPDIVLRRWNAVVFVNGCFWHGHDCGLFNPNDTLSSSWIEKIRANQERDQRAEDQLLEMGWRVAVVWECALGRRSKGKRKKGAQQKYNDECIKKALDGLESWIRDDKAEARIEFSASSITNA